jgi:hypothetical protein
MDVHVNISKTTHRFQGRVTIIPAPYLRNSRFKSRPAGPVICSPSLPGTASDLLCRSFVNRCAKSNLAQCSVICRKVFTGNVPLYLLPFVCVCQLIVCSLTCRRNSRSESKMESAIKKGSSTESQGKSGVLFHLN